MNGVGCGKMDNDHDDVTVPLVNGMLCRATYVIVHIHVILTELELYQSSLLN